MYRGPQYGALDVSSHDSRSNSAYFSGTVLVKDLLLWLLKSAANV